MKKLLILLIGLFCVGCFSAGKIVEDYNGPSVKTKSVGEGQTNIHFVYQGKNWNAEIGQDGKYHAKEEKK